MPLPWHRPGRVVACRLGVQRIEPGRRADHQAGWLLFDLNQFDRAGYYYDDARALAHEAQNLELGAMVLCQASHLAIWRGQPRTGIDHAMAAGQCAGRIGDLRLRAYTADVAARAYTADGQREPALTALDTAHAALPAAGDHTAGYAYFCDEALHIPHRGLCHLELCDGQPAADYAQQSLRNLDQSHARNAAFDTAHLGMVYVLCNDIDEGARLLGDAAEIAAGNSSARLTERMKQARAELWPWERGTAVRTLDDRLASRSAFPTAPLLPLNHQRPGFTQGDSAMLPRSSRYLLTQ